MRMRDLVELATSEPPPPRYTVDEIVEAGQRIQRRRRVGWATFGATSVVALGVAAAVALPSLLGPAPLSTAAASAPPTRTGAVTGTGTGIGTAATPEPAWSARAPFTFTFAGYRVGRLQVTRPIDVSTAYQLASVYADGLTTNDRSVESDEEPPSFKKDGPTPTLWAYLTVYQPGAYDPTKLVGAERVTVAGRPGLEVNSPTGPWAARRTLAWQYRENAWTVINSSSTEANYPSAEELRQLAAGLKAAPPTAAKVPFRMRYVPRGYQLDEVAMHAMTGLNGIAAARDGDYAGLLFSRPAQPTTGLTAPFGGVEGADPPGSFQIFVVPARNSNQQPAPGVSCGQGFCNRWFAGNSVKVQVSSGGRLSDREMRKVLDGITLANVRDEGTWLEVRTAIG